MLITVAAGLFIISYLIQILLCFKAKNRQIKLIPFYFGLVLAFLSFLLYAGFFGTMSMGMLGNGHGFLAVIILIAVFIMYAALLLAKITHIVLRTIQRRKVK